MGFFSWKTMDTNKSIANDYSNRPTFPVYMHDDKGNVWHEPCYQGYGDFGGKDYYDLVAEMNGYEGRDKGIDLEFKTDKAGIKFPNIVEAKDWKWQDKQNEYCPAQGFFYGDENDSEE
jgi:hypothetical protein